MLWQKDVRREQRCVFVSVCMCVFGGGGVEVQKGVGAGKGILDLRTAAAQGQKGSCPYLEVASSQPIVMD